MAYLKVSSTCMLSLAFLVEVRAIFVCYNATFCTLRPRSDFSTQKPLFCKPYPLIENYWLYKIGHSHHGKGIKGRWVRVGGRGMGEEIGRSRWKWPFRERNLEHVARRTASIGEHHGGGSQASS